MKKSILFALALAAICVIPLYGQNTKSETTGTLNGHEWIDLGLPSGTLWATCNVGANALEEYGDYFAWGETQSKNTYDWSTYKHMGSDTTLTKYCSNSNGFADTLTILLPQDDAATANWGDEWRMPTKEEFEELCNNTDITWVTQNGVNGRLFTASNGNSLFLPVAGSRSDNELEHVGSSGSYWSSSFSTDNPNNALYFHFSLEGWGIAAYYYCSGLSVRPVTSSH